MVEFEGVTWPYVLRRGHSQDPVRGACAMDAVNWLAHGMHGDKPLSACPLITAFVAFGNDMMDDDTRQRLLPYLHRIADSRSNKYLGDRSRILRIGGAKRLAARAFTDFGYPGAVKRLAMSPDEAGLGEITRLLRSLPRYKDGGRLFFATTSILNALAGNDSDLSFGGPSYLIAVAAMKLDAWDVYFSILDDVLNAGPQGEPWSVDVINAGDTAFKHAGGVAERITVDV